MQDTFFLLIKKAINHYLNLDPESKTRLASLDNRVITIELLGFNLPLPPSNPSQRKNLTFQLIFDDSEIQIKHDNFIKPDAHIRGTPLTLLRMSLTKENRKSFFADDLTIEGDLDFAQDVIDLFDHLEIDWEEYASQWIGDIPAHEIGRWVKRIKSFHQRSQDILLQNVNEYLHEEIAWYPTKELLADFFHEIDEIRMDVDRIEARIDRLKENKGSSTKLA